MKKLMNWLKNEESGQGMVEYGLILALIAVVVIGALTLLGTKVETCETTPRLRPGGHGAVPQRRCPRNRPRRAPHQRAARQRRPPTSGGDCHRPKKTLGNRRNPGGDP